MSGDSEAELKLLKDILGAREEEASDPTPFAQNVATVLTKAVVAMRAAGTIEVEDGNVDALAREVIDAALESSTLKRLPPRIVKTLIHSELVEEVYGTDEEIAAALRPFLDEL